MKNFTQELQEELSHYGFQPNKDVKPVYSKLLFGESVLLQVGYMVPEYPENIYFDLSFTDKWTESEKPSHTLTSMIDVSVPDEIEGTKPVFLEMLHTRISSLLNLLITSELPKLIMIGCSTNVYMGGCFGFKHIRHFDEIQYVLDAVFAATHYHKEIRIPIQEKAGDHQEPIRKFISDFADEIDYKKLIKSHKDDK